MTQSSLTLPIEARVTRVAETSWPLGQVGSWLLVRLAAQGTLAEVYQARPVTAPVDQAPAYALKLLREEWREDPRAVALLHREALVGRTVCHPHVVSILATGLTRPPHYLVMPWLEGATLETRLAAGRRFDLPVALWIARQVAEGLEGLHLAGWMHGDVKPANIHLSPQGHVTLLDLGFARRSGDADAAADRCVMGTCAYLAPEQVTVGLSPDIRSDLYSLGVVMFELLAGRRPFLADTMAELIAAHKEMPPPDLGLLTPRVPGGIARLVLAMLSKDPVRRPQTPRILIDQLAAWEIATFADRAG